MNVVDPGTGAFYQRIWIAGYWRRIYTAAERDVTAADGLQSGDISARVVWELRSPAEVSRCLLMHKGIMQQPAKHQAGHDDKF